MESNHMNLDLDKFDLKELRALKQRVDRAITDFEERQRAKALEAAKQVAEQFGFKLSDIVKSATVRAPVAPKYANPYNPEQTWTGRGRKPQWVQNHLDVGKSLEELAI